MIDGILRKVGFALVALFLVGPLVVVAGVSINEKQSLTFPPHGFSLAWYGQIFEDPGWPFVVSLAAYRALGQFLPVAGCRAVHSATRDHCAWYAQLLGDNQSLRPAMDSRYQPRDLFRNASAGDALARIFIDRSLFSRSSSDNGCG